jgi:hypothetical protein
MIGSHRFVVGSLVAMDASDHPPKVHVSLYAGIIADTYR